MQSFDEQVGAVKALYRELTPESVAGLLAVYHSDVLFTDPSGSLRGRARLRRHFEQLLAVTTRCAFAFDDERQVVDASAGGAALFWRMTLATPRLAGGREFFVDGASCLKFSDGLIITHRDYFDLGAMLYERVPLLGGVVRGLRKRIAPD